MISIDGIITSDLEYQIVTKGLPLTLTCSSRCRNNLCQVVWTTNKTSKFVKDDEEHTIWSTPSYKDTQNHHMTIHSATRSTDYQCLLISVTGRLIGTAEQHVDVKEPGK